ncbi:hypothetical protein SARC_11280 [Sphaeroforma arctica JP610]|uniref:Uncharacterized protein n=1 Tax=Sphaeroforma arctica JP610 TaxID=667725 RepID=A0A0L0FIC1_9EUKA|nr:hypothetical protein SARC_11280 [Sphaeroforma arctica JP610]KNC76211.1 hypothetical protein SARC_11280 [Sphaeroforma arctica JP610]|eukprot:XP_014150113.1 hypothetical protein SARC_11280 [Sphaeroforma arctica JP610]
MEVITDNASNLNLKDISQPMLQNMVSGEDAKNSNSASSTSAPDNTVTSTTHDDSMIGDQNIEGSTEKASFKLQKDNEYKGTIKHVMGESSKKREHRSEFVILGSGVSTGLPKTTCIIRPRENMYNVSTRKDGCNVCEDGLRNPRSKNRRGNVCALVRYKGKEILIDCGKTIREQCLQHFPRMGVETIHAIVLTHGHADAIFGLDEVRDIQIGAKKLGEVDGEMRWSEPHITPVYLNESTMKVCEGVFPYLMPNLEEERSERKQTRKQKRLAKARAAAELDATAEVKGRWRSTHTHLSSHTLCTHRHSSSTHVHHRHSNKHHAHRDKHQESIPASKDGSACSHGNKPVGSDADNVGMASDCKSRETDWVDISQDDGEQVETNYATRTLGGPDAAVPAANVVDRSDSTDKYISTSNSNIPGGIVGSVEKQPVSDAQCSTGDDPESPGKDSALTGDKLAHSAQVNGKISLLSGVDSEVSNPDMGDVGTTRTKSTDDGRSKSAGDDGDSDEEPKLKDIPRRVAALQWKVYDEDSYFKPFYPVGDAGLEFTPIPMFHGGEYVCMGFVIRLENDGIVPDVEDPLVSDNFPGEDRDSTCCKADSCGSNRGNTSGDVGCTICTGDTSRCGQDAQQSGTHLSESGTQNLKPNTRAVIAYLSDLHDLPPESLVFLKALPRIDLLVIDALSRLPVGSHYSLGQATALARELRPLRSVCVGMTCQLGLHDVVNEELREIWETDRLRFEMAWDGQTFGFAAPEVGGEATLVEVEGACDGAEKVYNWF